MNASPVARTTNVALVTPGSSWVSNRWPSRGVYVVERVAGLEVYYRSARGATLSANALAFASTHRRVG